MEVAAAGTSNRATSGAAAAFTFLLGALCSRFFFFSQQESTQSQQSQQSRSSRSNNSNSNNNIRAATIMMEIANRLRPPSLGLLLRELRTRLPLIAWMGLWSYFAKRKRRRSLRRRRRRISDDDDDDGSSLLSLWTMWFVGQALASLLEARSISSSRSRRVLPRSPVHPTQSSLLLGRLQKFLARPDDDDATQEGAAAPPMQSYVPEMRRNPLSAAATTNNGGKSKRYVEILVHNVSHTDLVFSLEATAAATTTERGNDDDNDDDDMVGEEQSALPAPSPAVAGATTDDNKNSNDDGDDDHYCLCRPRFSCFVKYSRTVLDHLLSISTEQQQEQQQADQIISFPRYRRQAHGERRIDYEGPEGVATPVGLQLSGAAVPHVDMSEVRLRGRDQARLFSNNFQRQQQQAEAEAEGETTAASAGTTNYNISIRHVFFPLLATLLPKWRERIAQTKYPSDAATIKRVLILVSGVGTPRNWTHDARGNSTEYCAQLLREFLKRVDPTLTVVHIHSETNLFRYDENLCFVEKELMPTIQAYRDAHARHLPYPDELLVAEQQQQPPHDDGGLHPFSVDWRKSFRTTISFADGSPARTYAIQAALRPYKPTYFHFWQLKTFWHESKLVLDDLEIHSFEAMETIPAISTASCTDESIRRVVDEIKAFRDQMSQVLLGENNDIHKFWLRKTHKPVLAVLLVQAADMDEPALYRGTNMEVSMPTGSLCAERNVIGSALADRPNLKREDLKFIAVLAVPLSEQHQQAMRRVSSCVSTEDLPSRKPSVESEAAALGGGGVGDHEWIMPVPPLQQPRSSEDSAAAAAAAADHISSTDDSSSGVATANAAPLRQIALFSKCSCPNHKNNNSSGGKRTVVLQSTSSDDLNPLSPCGACNEWLLKIAECNPYFRVLTFTDVRCTGVYITPCQE